MRNRKHPPKLTRQQILAWADAYHACAGRWPTVRSGAIMEAPHTTRQGVHDALYLGQRGLPGGSSLARLLARARGVRNIRALTPLNLRQILRWADAHERRTGTQPTRDSGPIVDAHGETWGAIDYAARFGRRGLRGQSSLAKLLARLPRKATLGRLS
jgi:hypothetical protein